MIRYAAKRVLVAVPILLVVTFLCFYLVNLLPGDPTTTICGPSCTAAAKAKLIHQMGLDKSIMVRYWIFLKNLTHLDFGQSYANNTPISTELSQRLPVTLELMILSQILAILISVPTAIYSALRPDGLFDRISSSVSFGLLAVPAFIIGTFLVETFAVKIHMFPATGYTPLTENIGENLRALVLPAVTLGIGSIATYHRVLRSDLIATLQEDYITMAKAKGMPTWYIMTRHAFRPSTITLVTLTGLNIGGLITGAVVVEVIFALPGVGTMLIEAMNSRDYLAVQGVAVVVTVGFVLLNILADIGTAVIDPRLRREGAPA